MPRLLFNRLADGHIDIVQNKNSAQAAAPLQSAPRESGFVAIADRNAPGGRVDRVDTIIMWTCVAILATVSAYFAFRCIQFMQG
jgi:hypothetical protein